MGPRDKHGGVGWNGGVFTITTVNCVGLVRLAVTAMTPVQVPAAADAHRFAAEVARQAASCRYIAHFFSGAH